MVAFDLKTLSAQEAADFNGPADQVFEVENVSENFAPRPDLNINVGRWPVVSFSNRGLPSSAARHPEVTFQPA